MIAVVALLALPLLWRLTDLLLASPVERGDAGPSFRSSLGDGLVRGLWRTVIVLGVWAAIAAR